MRELSVKVTSFPTRFANTGFRFLRRFHFCDQGVVDEWPLPNPTYYRRARSSFFEGVSQLCYCEEESPLLCGEDHRPNGKYYAKRIG